MAARTQRNDQGAPGPAPRRLRRVAMQLDDEIVQHFKKLAADGGGGERYTALINQVLLEHVQAVRNGGGGDAGSGMLARSIRLELERLIAPN